MSNSSTEDDVLELALGNGVVSQIDDACCACERILNDRPIGSKSKSKFDFLSGCEKYLYITRRSWDSIALRPLLTFECIDVKFSSVNTGDSDYSRFFRN